MEMDHLNPEELSPKANASQALGLVHEVQGNPDQMSVEEKISHLCEAVEHVAHAVFALADR